MQFLKFIWPQSVLGGGWQLDVQKPAPQDTDTQSFPGALSEAVRSVAVIQEPLLYPVLEHTTFRVSKFSSSCAPSFSWWLVLCLHHVYIRRALISGRHLWWTPKLLSLSLDFWLSLIREQPLSCSYSPDVSLDVRVSEASTCSNFSCGSVLENCCLNAVYLWCCLFLLLKVIMWQCDFNYKM